MLVESSVTVRPCRICTFAQALGKLLIPQRFSAGQQLPEPVLEAAVLEAVGAGGGLSSVHVQLPGGGAYLFRYDF